MDNNITNWYTKIPKEFKAKEIKDPTFKNHLIKLNSMVLVVGSTGSGKTNAVVDFLHRSNGRYYDIIIFTGSNRDEPLYNSLERQVQGLKIIDKIDEMPQFSEISEKEDKEYKDFPKLIIWDDSIFLDKKLLKNIEKFYMSSRKFGWTNFFLSQNYVSTPIFIRRNLHYLMLFKVSDTKDLKNILKTVAGDIKLNVLQNMLNYATKEPMNFLTIAFAESDINKKFRHNFTELLKPTEFL